VGIPFAAFLSAVDRDPVFRQLTKALRRWEETPMQGLVSNRRFSVASSAGSLAVVWLACSIFSVPYGFGWRGPGWTALAVSVALCLSSFAAFDAARRREALR
jgi:hypothetical protein